MVGVRLIAIDDGAGCGRLVRGVEHAQSVCVRRGAIRGGLTDEAIAKGVVHIATCGARGEDVARRGDMEVETALDAPQEVGGGNARTVGGGQEA